MAPPSPFFAYAAVKSGRQGRCVLRLRERVRHRHDLRRVSLNVGALDDHAQLVRPTTSPPGSLGRGLHLSRAHGEMRSDHIVTYDHDQTGRVQNSY